MNRIVRKGMGAAAGTALIAAAVIAASPAYAAHNPRPGGPAGASAGQVAPETGQVAPQAGPRPAGLPLRPLVGNGTITVEQARAVREQLRTDAQAAREQARTTALTTLVGEGAITQAQADAIVAAGRGGLRTLVGSGTLTQEQAREVQAEFTEYGSTDTTAASLASLVAAGVITQAQADVIGDLVPAPGTGS